MIANQTNLAGMSRGFQALFMESFGAVQPTYTRIATVVPSTTRVTDYGWLGSFPMLREWVGDRVVHALKAGQYSIANKEFEATVEVKRADVDDDNLGVYAPLFQQLGQNAALHPEMLIYALLKLGFNTKCFDGQYFFDSDHEVAGASVGNTGGGSGTPWFLLCTSQVIKPLLFQSRKPPQLVAQDQPTDEQVFMRNSYRYGVDYRGNVGYGLWQLAYGSKQTLDAASYAAARAAMMSMTNDAGVPLGIKPDLLVVPPTLESTVKSLIQVDTLATGGGNPWYNTCDVLVSPWLA